MATRKPGRPSKDIDPSKLKTLMRLKPSLDDTASFFECSQDTIERFIKKHFGLKFAEFRDQNMSHTRFMLVRTALDKAKGGDNCMLIFCLKNLCGWKDKFEHSAEDVKPFKLAYELDK